MTDNHWTLSDAATFTSHYASLCDTLNDTYCRAHPLLSSVFVGSLVTHFGTPGDLIALHHSAGHIDGLMVLRNRRPAVWTTFQPSQAPLAISLLPPTANPIHLLPTLPGANFTLELLTQDPQYSPVLAFHRMFPSDLVPYWTTINVALTGCFDDYWSARSAGVRDNIRRHLRRVINAGHVPRLDVVTETEHISSAVASFGDIESRSWKARYNTAVHASNLQGRFYTDVLTRLAADKRARIYQLYFGDRLVASEMCVNNAEMLITLKTTYDEELRKLAPGRLLLFLLLKREFEYRQFNTVEFYTNANADDLKWSTSSRHLYHLRTYRSALVKAALAQCRRILGRHTRVGIATSNDVRSSQ